MSEDSGGKRRERHVRAAAAGGGAAVGGLAAGPVGAIAGAALGPFLEPFAQKVFDELGADSRRASEVLASASEASGLSVEELSERIGESERARLQGGIALSAATRTAWPHKVRMLGRVLVSGLLANDEDTIMVEEYMLAAVADIERAHLSLLELLVDGRSGRHPRWTAYAIGNARPRLRPVLTSLIGTLVRHGLAVQDDNTNEVLKRYDTAMGIAISGGAPPGQSVRPPDTSWSATPLGEQVLSKYQELGAGAEDAKA